MALTVPNDGCNIDTDNNFRMRSTIQHVSCMDGIQLGTAQDVTFFYLGSYLSELESCAIISSTLFILFSHCNSARHNLVIELCRALGII